MKAVRSIRPRWFAVLLCGVLAPMPVLLYAQAGASATQALLDKAHALEVRVPFCDHILAERVAGLPALAKMPVGTQKGSFRWAMRNDLPSSVSLHRKVGFNPPISAWLRGPLCDLADRYLGDDAIRSRGLLSRDTVKTLRTAFADAHGQVGHVLWALLVLEAWLQWLE